MSPEARLTLLHSLIVWSLGSSEAIQGILKDRYKQQRHDDDRNQPLSVQPWGRDGDKRRESNPALKNITWRSVAGTVEELQQTARKLSEDGSQAARKLCDSIQAAIPRFEAGEDKRKRREYRLARKAQFVRPEPGFSLYEGRTRGKKTKYTYSDEDEVGSDAQSIRRSNRQSGLSTPAEPARPTVTASGRQVRSRYGGHSGGFTVSGQQEHGQSLMINGVDGAAEDGASLGSGRATRSSGRRGRPTAAAYSSKEDSDDGSQTSSSSEDWDGEDDEDGHAEQAYDALDEEEMNDVISDEDELALTNGQSQQRSLVVTLRYPKAARPAQFTTIKGLSDPLQRQSLSDQAPPAEANPFASAINSEAAVPTNLSNRLALTTYDTADGAVHNEASNGPPLRPYDRGPWLT
ncbi:MAG: hypothetical protein Q9174_000131 [Haloplaca sp. 1 TL-2023]